MAIICILKPFLGNWSILHSDFHLYSLTRIDNRKDMRVLIVVIKDILNNVIIENQTDLISQLYCIILDIIERNLVSRKYFKRIKIITFYNNKIESRCIWQGSSYMIQQVIYDIRWNFVIQEQVLVVGE